MKPPVYGSGCQKAARNGVAASGAMLTDDPHPVALNRTTNELIWWADSRNVREPGVSIGPLAPANHYAAHPRNARNGIVVMMIVAVMVIVRAAVVAVMVMMIRMVIVMRV
ncbi:MAG: hypothetical protein ACREE9_02475 [Stellaceae bacterium]